VIPNVGVTIHPDNSCELQDSTLTISLPVLLDVSSSKHLLDEKSHNQSQWFGNELTPQLLDKLTSILGSAQNAELKKLSLNDDLNATNPNTIPELFQRARKCIENSGIELCPDGVGGTYFIKDDAGNTIGIFKPNDEEPGAVNNPKQLLDEPLMPPGGGAKREVAAYLLDHGRSGVPETYFLENVKNNAFCSDATKSGSIQKYVKNIGDTTSVGSSLFPVQDVHNIGILDIRLMNMDRNDENMLVAKEDNNYRLIPIDHAYTLPSKLDNVWFDWMYWKQAKEPFNQNTLEYIKNIDIPTDSAILHGLGFEAENIQTMQIATTLLKCGARAGLTLFDIASLVSRKKPTIPSELEKIVAQCSLVKDNLVDLAELEHKVDAYIQSNFQKK